MQRCKEMGVSVFGAKKSDTVNDDGTANSVAQKHIDQQSVLLTWNGPWGELSQDPLLLELWPFLRGPYNADGHAVFHAAQEHRCF